MAVVDELEIKLKMDAQNAANSIDALLKRLDALSISLSSINGSRLNDLGKGVQSLATGMQSFKGIGSKKFENLAAGINQLANINEKKLNDTATAISRISQTFTNLASVSGSTTQLAEVTKAIGKLGSVSVERATKNIPQLATALSGLMATLSRAPRVSQNVIDMTNALANLSAQGNRVGSASKMFEVGMNRTTTSVNRTNKSFKGLASTIGKFYATYWGFIRGFKGIWKSINSTADYIEAYNYFDVALGKIGKDWSHEWEKYADETGATSAKEYAESFSTRLQESLKPLSGISVGIGADGKGILEANNIKNLGLNIQEVTQYASQLASVTNSLGQTGEVSLATASAFSKLGGDMSSLFNVDYADVMQNLQSGLIGQSRALYKYGIDITNATLQTLAYELGIEKSVSEMSQAEKQQLRIIQILRASKVSWGDLSNTIASPSNMLRQLSTNVKEVGMMLGQLFIPALEYTLPVINGVTLAIKQLLASMADLLGITINFEGFGKGVDQTGEDMSNLTDEMEDANKALEEYKNQAMGFDEINPIKDVNASVNVNGSVGSSIDLTDEILKATEEYEKAWQEAYDRMENRSQNIADRIVKGFKSSFKKAGWGGVGQHISDSIASSLKSADWESVNNRMTTIATDMANFLNGLITPELLGAVGTTFAQTLNTVINAKETLGENINFDQVGEAIGTGINSFFEDFDFKGLGTTIGTWVSGLFSALVSAIGEVEWKNVFSGLYEVLEGLTSAIGIEDSTAIDMLVTSLLAFKGVSVITGTIGTVLGKLKSLVTFVTSSPWNMAITAISALAATIIYAWADGDVDYMTEDLQKIADKADAAADAAEDLRDELNNLDGDTYEGKELEILADKFYDLSIQEGKSKDEMALLKQYSDDLVELMPDLKDKIDEQTGAYKGTKDELDKLVNKTKEYYKIQATEDIMKKIISNMAQTELDLAAAEKERKERFQEAYEFLHDPEHQDPYSTTVSVSNEYKKEYNKLRNRVLEADASIESLKNTLEDYNNQYEIASEYLSGLDSENKASSVGLPSLPNTTGGGVTIPLSLKWKIDDREIDFLGIGEESKSVGEKIVDGLSTGITSKDSATTSIAKSMGSIASKMVETYGTLSGKAKTQGSGIVWNLGQGIKGSDSAKTAIGTMASGITSTLGSKYNTIKSDVSSKGKGLVWNLGQGIIKSDSATTAFTNLFASLSKIANKDEVKTDFVTAGKNIIEGLVKGLKDPKTLLNLATTVAGLGGTVSGIFKGLLDINSPSGLFEEYAMYTIQGYNLGIEKYAPTTVDTMEDWGSMITDASMTLEPQYLGNANSEEILLLRQQNMLLQALLNKEAVEIKGDAKQIFKVVQKQANNYTIQTGEPAFI